MDWRLQLQPVPPEAMTQARKLVSEFAAASAHSALFEELLGRSLPPAELPDHQAVSSHLVYLRDPAALGKLFAQKQQEAVQIGDTDVVLEWENPAAQLWNFASTLTPTERRALDVILRRAADPVESLATWPLEALFLDEEAAALRAAVRSPEPLETPLAEWAPGSDANYHGYVCIIAKFTRLCNLRCVYCHDWRNGPNQTMRFPVQLKFLQNLIEERQHSAIDLFWHGGEPTLIGRRGFLRVLAIQRWFQRPRQRLRNILQTNATTLNTQWTEFLSRYRFEVSLSLDGPAEIQDQTRPHITGRPTLELVRNGIRALKTANIPFSLLIVIGERHLKMGADTLVRFLQEEGVGKVGMLPVRPIAGPARLGEFYLTPEAFTRFLLDVDSARQSRPEPWLGVRELDAAHRASSGNMPGFCELFGNCVGSYFAVDPDGTVSHCDKFVGDPDYVLGNLMHQNFADIRAGEPIAKLAVSAKEAVAKKESCEYFKYCRGWCPHEDYMASRFLPGYDGSCCGLSGLFAAMKEQSSLGLS